MQITSPWALLIVNNHTVANIKSNTYTQLINLPIFFFK